MLITFSEESYRVCVCVCVCLSVYDLETKKNSPDLSWAVVPQKKKKIL